MRPTSETHKTTEFNGKSVTAKAMPHGWRARLSTSWPPGNANEVIKATTWALARDLEAQHGIDGANSENLKRAYLDEIFAQVLKTPGNRTDEQTSTSTTPTSTVCSRAHCRKLGRGAWSVKRC